MVALTGRTPASSYKDLLQVSNSNSGIDSVLRSVEDGEGSTSTLQISTTKVNIQSGFQLGGVDVTITASQLNALGSGGGTTNDTLRLNSGITSSFKPLRDGTGAETVLQVSTSGTRLFGDVFIGATRLTATAQQLNDIVSVQGVTAGHLKAPAAISGAVQNITDNVGNPTALALSSGVVRVNGSLNLNGTLLDSNIGTILTGLGPGTLKLPSALSSSLQQVQDNSGAGLPIQISTTNVRFNQGVDLGTGTFRRNGVNLIATFEELNAVAAGETTNNVLYVNTTGVDTNDGSSMVKAKRTIKSAIARAAEIQQADLVARSLAGASLPVRARSTIRIVIKVSAGDYTEDFPIDMGFNMSVVGDSLRSVSVRPSEATKNNNLFRVDGGSYLAGMTFRDHQHPSFAVVFKPGAYILASPYVQNCSSITAAQDDGQAGSVSIGLTGGGMKIDGYIPDVSSPIKSMVADAFTQINLGGPGFWATNDGYVQLVSCFGTFCSYHVRADNGGQVNLSNSTTDFGDYGLISYGKSPSPIYTGTVSSNRSGLNLNQIRVDSLGTNRPYGGMIMEFAGSSQIYTVQSSTAPSGGQCTILFAPSLDAGAIPSSGVLVRYFNRSMVATGSHTMEYVGSGTNYLSLPWNGGVPMVARECEDDGVGRVYYTSTDHLGNFKVGAFLAIDQASGTVTIPETANLNLSSLGAIGPFKRILGGISTAVGVQLQEVSNSSDLISTTGFPDSNTVPTQTAVKSYVDSRIGAVINMLFANTSGGNSSWTMTADGRNYGPNPVIRMYRGFEYKIEINPSSISTAFGFFIKTAVSAGNANAYNTGVTNNGANVGFINFKVPYDAPARLYYVASGFSGAMFGEIWLFDPVEYSTISGRPTALSAFTNDSGYVTATNAPVRSVAGKTGLVSLVAGDVSGLATVATTGVYSDLTGRPTIGVSANNLLAVDSQGRLPEVPLFRPELRESRLRESVITGASGSITLDYAVADRFRVTASGNISAIVVSNMPSARAASIIVEVINWGNFVVIHPATARFAAGVSPAYTQNGTDIIAIEKNSADVFTYLMLAKNVKVL